MNVNALLNQCLRKLKVQSDYALAKKLEIPEPRISEYRSGKATPDVYACMRIALCLEIDPMELVAEAEIVRARTDKKREFWQGFLSQMQRNARALLLLAGLAIFGAGFATAPGGIDKTALPFLRRRYAA